MTGEAGLSPEPGLRREPGPAHSRLAAGAEKLLLRPAWRLVEELEAFSWTSAAHIDETSRARAMDLLRYAAEEVPYYGRILAEHGLDAREITPQTWDKVPVLTKAALREAFPEELASRRRPRPRRAYATSGSTGFPLRVYRDPSARVADQAVRRWHYGWCGVGPGDIVAYIKLMPLFSRLAYPFWAAFSGGRVYNAGRHLGHDHRRLSRALNRWRPAALYGDAMTLAEVGALLEDAGEALRFTPRAIISGAVTLTPTVERYLARVFGAPVHNRYGAAEFGTWIAQSCPDLVREGMTASENLHVNAWRFLVEIADDGGRPVGPGREGRVLITDLANRVMPIIRYDIGDVGVLAEAPCPCGRGLPLLRNLYGRTNEMVVLPSGRSLVGWRLYVALEPHAGALRAYQFAQTAPDRLLLIVVPAAASFGAADAARFEAVIREVLPEPMEVSVEVVKEIPTGPSGKRTILRPLETADSA